MSLIPVTILTGFLGSGKTTLLKRLLSEAHGQKIAVIENEFGAENIDTDILVTESKEQIVQMNNGCICCTIREDLRATLQLLASKKRQGLLDFERIVIETTGLADPGPVAQTFFMDDEVAQSCLIDAIITLVDAKHATGQLNDRQEARRQVGFADQIFLSKTDLVSAEETRALIQRLKHMNPRAPIQAVHFGAVPIGQVLDLRGFNLHAKLDIDPDFLSEQDAHGHGHEHEHEHHEHAHGAHCDHPSHQHGGPGHHHHDDDVKSFVFRSERPFDPARLEDFLGAMVNVYGPRMLRYKGVLQMKGTDRKVIFQGVHQLMGSDLGPQWADGEARTSKMVFIGIDLPRDIFLQGLEQSLV
ncbi:CobW family GTP-binding protein [Verminephrobacter eiseniae]|uniref:Cobalamin synthesis protein, P47K n=1 Tax=Verminephrobacter eiseniae (strain EF01-2) TaxID=391735 RepID=A1WRJ7_VEREI|nr:GTP-binding protein [Verminephrobacter eiseniae]ABM60254.1 cobalamin synthesis protein, P47K [Verminephrobacter eiseniae EF01-2]MCW5285740.1 GTP-binding protein [Verminephrobacter eiseniae]MCW5304039.1 GTP-binding protein [Verminephrobacter eiseniae]MCW8182735.1 GTP-binding protein [Verminephrobacter eiseniae]MCW8191270.1 GTP-binding protein [Verminephrobacter eiseniae]